MDSGKRNIVFLYTEMAGYFLACLEALADQLDGDILVFHWPVNKEAPFEFQKVPKTRFVDRQTVTDDQILAQIERFQPSIIVSSGWMDKGYMNVLKRFDKVQHRVVALDNHWRGGLRQQAARIASPFVLKQRFNCAWVPGTPQRTFARKLGFDKILDGFYCADTSIYQSYYKEYSNKKATAMPKRFLYVGRYVEHKGIFEMWEAFKNVSDNFKEWELWCVGTGDQYDKRTEHPRIRHFGFKQPHELGALIEQTSVFIMPSKFEPWGVVAQEFAAAGMVLALSDQVGAGTKFLDEGVNGRAFKAGSVSELQNVMMDMMKRSQTELVEMADASARIGASHSPYQWAETLLSLY